MIGKRSVGFPMKIPFPRGTIKQLSAGTKHSVVLTNDSRVFISGQLASTLGPTWIHSELLTHAPIVKVFSGYSGSIFETENGALEVIGDNSYRVCIIYTVVFT
jgi:alpha-tubulin suppressor-like RCC1 family protein